MKKIYWAFVCFAFIACTSEDLLQTEDHTTNEVTEPVLTQNYENGFVRIMVTENLSDKMEAAAIIGERRTKAMAADNTVSEIKIRSVERTFPHAGSFEARTRKAGLHLWYDVEFDTQVPLDEARKNLSGIKGVRKVEYRPVVARYENGRVLEVANQMAQNVAKPSAAMPFNDPELSKQWHYYNDGSLGDKYVAGADINLFNAWDYTTGSPEVVVAIIDGGIDYTHEDLAANMWVNNAEKNGTSSVDDDNNGFKDDIHGYNFVANIGKLVPNDHGTHVAGVIAAVTNNGKGVSGIAGGNGQSGSGVRLMSCQIFVDEDDPYSENAGQNGAPAIKYAADNGAVICQNSWGYPTLTEIPASDKAAIDYFIQYAGIDENGRQTGAMRGGIVIFAAGNENRAAAAPANYEKVVAVSSIAPDFRKAYYSNFGSWIDLAAPGGDVQSFGNKGTILSTIVDGYGYMQGTSMACPHVSGVAALVLSYYKGSGFNPDMLRARLENGATNIDSYNSSYKGKIGKLVNAHASLASGSTTPPNNIGTVNGTVQSNVVTLNWTIPSDPDDGKPTGFNVYYRKTPLTGINVKNPPSDVEIRSFSTGLLNAGDLFETQIEGLDFDTKYYFAVNAFDFSGNMSTLTSQITRTTLSNKPPVINVLDSTNVALRAYQSTVLHFSGTDPDNHEVWWSMEPSSSAGVTLVDMGGGQIQITITGALSQPGKYSLDLILEDEYGATATEIINYEILENHAPEVVTALDNVTIGSLNKEISFSLSAYFRDQDNEPLKFTFNNTAPHIVNVNENKGLLYIVSLANGLAQVTVTATDVMGLSVSQQFSILIRDELQEIDIYPNPVKDFVWLRTGENQRSLVTIFNNAGVKVFEDEIEISPFAPAKIDMSSFSGGVYSVNVKYADKDIHRQIIKL
ncbi:MAG: S8 family serine peptidase [Proteiniphilum sp.]|nr:S8 family serine peptidase [Proteiniphilum sp.]